MTAHAERKHHELGPSQSHRWRPCIPSIALCASLPEPPPTQASLDGTRAHEWGEHCLRNGEWDATEHVGDKLEGHSEALTRDMAENVNAHLGLIEKILAPEDELFIETRFSLAKYFGGTPDGDGTADCVIYKPATKHLHVIDYKNGYGVVEVEGNTQAIQYALGAWEIFKSRGVQKITIWIVQPKCGPPKKWSISAADIFDHGEDLKDDYAKTKLPGQPFVPGKHCRFCKANIFGKCAALREHSEREAAIGFEAIKADAGAGAESGFLTPQDLGDMLKRAEAIRVYLKALDELAESEARAGRIPAGKKWVATPGRRIWNPELGSDEDVAKAIRTVAPTLAVWEKTLRTAPALEKELGKADFKELQESFAQLMLEQLKLQTPAVAFGKLSKTEIERLTSLVTKTAGGFSLADEDDRRPAVEYGRAAEGFEAIT